MKKQTRFIAFDNRRTHTKRVNPAGLCPAISDAIKFHGLDAILDWLAAWHIWPRFHVKFFDRRELVGAYHLAKKSGNFGVRSNGKAIFRKIFSEIVDNLQR